MDLIIEECSESSFYSFILNNSNDIAHFIFPVMEFLSHGSEMSHVQVPGHDPVNVGDFVDLVNDSLDELEAHGLHDQDLHQVLLDEAVLGDQGEGQASLVLPALEQ